MKIMVGIDGSSEARAGVRFIASLPLSSEDEVLLASVAERPVMVGAWGYIDTDLNRNARAEAWKAAAEHSGRLVEHAQDEFRGLPCRVSGLVLEGHPIEALGRAVRAHAADLLVVGPQGRGRLESILMGSVTQSLLHAMPTSILVARDPVSVPQRVLLATDGSPASLAAAAFLATFPLPADAAIEIVTVLATGSGSSTSGGVASPRDLGEVEEHAAAAAIDPVLKVLDAAGRTGRPSVRKGDPKREILAATREAEAHLLVTGARGLGGFSGLVLGSVSRALAKAAPCSVLVVPGRPGADR
jgi:nucleotide-binding universal stress UspA family protein